jgi:hypothetical protein
MVEEKPEAYIKFRGREIKVPKNIIEYIEDFLMGVLPGLRM